MHEQTSVPNTFPQLRVLPTAVICWEVILAQSAWGFRVFLCVHTVFACIHVGCDSLQFMGDKGGSQGCCRGLQADVGQSVALGAS